MVRNNPEKSEKNSSDIEDESLGQRSISPDSLLDECAFRADQLRDEFAPRMRSLAYETTQIELADLGRAVHHLRSVKGGATAHKQATTIFLSACESVLQATKSCPVIDGCNAVEAVGRLMIELLGEGALAGLGTHNVQRIAGLVVQGLQVHAPLVGIECAQAYIQAGGSLSSPTILCSICEATRQANDPADVAVILKFAEDVLARGLVLASSSKTVGVYNVLLAVCGEPVPTRRRLGARYRDLDTVDVADRLLSASSLALAVMDANVPFTKHVNEGRVNLLLRALCSASLLLDVEQARMWEDLSLQQVIALRREIGVDSSLRSFVRGGWSDVDVRSRAQALVSRALVVAEAAVRVMKDADHTKPLRYEIRGSTINLLSNAAFFADSLTIAEGQRLMSILSTSLELDRVRKKLYSNGIENAVLAAISAAHGSESAPELLDRITSTFALALRKGFTFPTQIMERVRDLCSDMPSDQQMSDAVQYDRAYIEERLQRLQQQPRQRTPAVPAHPGPLKGGLTGDQSGAL